MYTTCVWVPAEARKGRQGPGAGAMSDWSTRYSYWELDVGPLGEQQAFKSLRHLSGPKKKFLNNKILSSRRHKTIKYISDKTDISSVREDSFPVTRDSSGLSQT